MTTHQIALSPLRFFSRLRRVLLRRTPAYFAAVGLLLIIAMIAAIAVGATDISPGVILRVLGFRLLPEGWVDAAGVSESEQAIVWFMRVPRVLVAALVGAALSCTGVQMQGLFHNPLASPDIVGTSSGGALGAVFALATGLAARSVFYLPMFSVLGALIALFVVYLLSAERGRTPVASLLLSGIALNAMLAAMTSFIITMTSVRHEVAQEIIFWLLGGLDGRTWQHVWFALPFIAIGLAIGVAYARDLDLLLMGEEAAGSLGVEVQQVKRTLLVSAALLTGTAVAVSGVIGFVGLLVPHIVRLLIGPAHRRLLPAAALTGAVFLVLADLLARTLTRPEEVRLGIITAFFGAPFFLYLLVQRRREAGYL